eukprot:3140114-Karenia_brevis.AAC.1
MTDVGNIDNTTTDDDGVLANAFTKLQTYLSMIIESPSADVKKNVTHAMAFFRTIQNEVAARAPEKNKKR